jgi:hypothetical protein
MTRDQAKRCAIICEAMAILHRQQADLDREMGIEQCAAEEDRMAEHFDRLAADVRSQACATH